MCFLGAISCQTWWLLAKPPFQGSKWPIRKQEMYKQGKILGQSHQKVPSDDNQLITWLGKSVLWAEVQTYENALFRCHQWTNQLDISEVAISRVKMAIWEARNVQKGKKSLVIVIKKQPKMTTYWYIGREKASFELKFKLMKMRFLGATSGQTWCLSTKPPFQGSKWPFGKQETYKQGKILGQSHHKAPQDDNQLISWAGKSVLWAEIQT